ncbi:hypothetical protein DSC45_34760 [Streptomyces sp. YIM 130001]|uniref:hypothetical protein n=1 Tax=Streptomyces sp. YIM 130001 TaxID=2259644 RepID=UPI000E64B681|nr:hypothetical protein [Streptomyces sp. YIM 130001]RII06992.1 hypothetical protein DSC45_34760 [Streptomyces sp. YIM 130001]
MTEYSLLLVRDGDDDVWLAAERGGLVFVYLPASEQFVLHDALSADWLDPSSTMSFVPVTVTDALRIAKDGKLGRHADILRDATERLDAQAVLEPAVQDPRGVADDSRKTLESAPLATWVSLREFPPEEDAEAREWASDVRTGKNSTYAQLGRLEVRTEWTATRTARVVIARRMTPGTEDA